MAFKEDNERKFLLWFIGILMSIISFVGILGVTIFMDMNRAIHRIEIKMAADDEHKKTLEYRLGMVEKKVDESNRNNSNSQLNNQLNTNP